jgi:hypothetical protein
MGDSNVGAAGRSETFPRVLDPFATTRNGRTAMTWGISSSLVTKSDLKEKVVDSYSLGLERAAYRLQHIFSYAKAPTMQKEPEIRSLPAPSLQSFLTRASATPNKVSASRRPPIGGVIGGSPYLESKT